MMELIQGPSPNSSEDSSDITKASKRKRVEEENEGQNKRRSEEPLFKIIHKLVDETEKSSRESSCESDKENVSSNEQKGSECEREDGAEKSGGGEMSLENSPI